MPGYRLSAPALSNEAHWARSRGIETAPRAMMAGPVPQNTVDGRAWGDDFWETLRSIPSEANTAETAARVSAVNFCVSIIAEAVGSLQGGLVDSKLHPVDVPLSDVLFLDPNNGMYTSAEFWAAMAYTAALRGVAFAEPVAGFDGVEIWPLDPLRSDVEWHERSFTMRYHGEARTRTLLPQQLFWFSGLADATARPLVPWKMAKGSIDLQLALENGARTFFRNNQRFSGVLSTDHKLTDTSLERIKAGIARWKNGGIPVLEQGLEFQNTQGTNSDAQLTELIRQRTLEMARYWRIPRGMIAEESGTATSQEQEALQFVKYSIRPWVRRIEQAITVRLLPPDMKAAGIRARFNLNSLLRGDSATQHRNAVLARTAGTHSVDEMRVNWFDEPAFGQEWSRDPRAPLNSNRAADTMTGGETSPQDKLGINP